VKKQAKWTTETRQGEYMLFSFIKKVTFYLAFLSFVLSNSLLCLLTSTFWHPSLSLNFVQGFQSNKNLVPRGFVATIFLKLKENKTHTKIIKKQGIRKNKTEIIATVLK